VVSCWAVRRRLFPVRGLARIALGWLLSAGVLDRMSSGVVYFVSVFVDAECCFGPLPLWARDLPFSLRISLKRL
jgi:hypothetical protein